MRRSSYQTLIDRGRKAGLRTTEMYAALSSEPMTAEDEAGQVDGNGLIAGYDDHGHPIFEPSVCR
jgi:hypothetical protein